MSTLPPAPDPGGPIPDDWKPQHWLAYRAWVAGGSYRDVAIQSGYAVNTIKAFLSNLNKKYDMAEVRAKRETNRAEAGDIPPEDKLIVPPVSRRNYQTYIRGRADVASSALDDVAVAREIIGRELEQIKQADERLSIGDLKDLVAIMRTLLKIGDDAIALRAFPGTPHALEGDPLASADSAEEIIKELEMLADAYLGDN